MYKELVETNTTLSAGSCTLAAQRMAARLKAAGYKEGDIRLFGVPDHPKEDGLVATLNGTDPKAKAILLLAHIDVVEAKREDWTRDPFWCWSKRMAPVYYGRGSSDEQGASCDLHRYALDSLETGWNQASPAVETGPDLHGEETGGAFNGANWLVTEHKDWIDAQFALNVYQEASACAMRAAKTFARYSSRGEGLPGFPDRGEQPRWPQQSPAPGQRHLQPGRGARSHRSI